MSGFFLSNLEVKVYNIKFLEVICMDEYNEYFFILIKYIEIKKNYVRFLGLNVWINVLEIFLN